MKRLSIATIAGFAPVTGFVLSAALAPGQTLQQRFFYALKNLAKSFTTVNLEEPDDWKYPNHPHVEFVWPFYVNPRSSSTESARWGSVKTHTIWGTYVPIFMGILTHKLFTRSGINRFLEDKGLPFDI